MDDEVARLPLDERRRDIYRRSAEKFRALGMPIDSDPTFDRLIEAWIEGSIEMSEVARAYADFWRPGPHIPIAKPALPHGRRRAGAFASRTPGRA